MAGCPVRTADKTAGKLGSQCLTRFGTGASSRGSFWPNCSQVLPGRPVGSRASLTPITGRERSGKEEGGGMHPGLWFLIKRLWSPELRSEQALTSAPRWVGLPSCRDVLGLEGASSHRAAGRRARCPCPASNQAAWGPTRRPHTHCVAWPRGQGTGQGPRVTCPLSPVSPWGAEVPIWEEVTDAPTHPTPGSGGKCAPHSSQPWGRSPDNPPHDSSFPLRNRNSREATGSRLHRRGLHLASRPPTQKALSVPAPWEPAWTSATQRSTGPTQSKTEPVYSWIGTGLYRFELVWRRLELVRTGSSWSEQLWDGLELVGAELGLV